ncbi:MAG: serine hydrolase [Acidobacteriota bacterium]
MKTTIRLLCTITLHITACAITFAQASSSSLDARVKAEVAKFKGQVALYAKNLDTGDSYGLQPDERVRTASTIKTAIMVEAFARVAEGKSKWTDELILTEAKKQQGSGILMVFGEGLKITLRDAVTLMIVVSDNTATNLVLDVVTADAVNARMEALGFKQTRSMRKIGGGGESKAFSDPLNKRANGSPFGIGVTTAREMETLVEKLERGEIVSPAASKEMVAILRKQQSREGIGRNILGVDLASKTGALDALRADVGILYSPRGRIAMAIYCDDMPQVAWTVDNPALLLMSRLSEILVDGLGREPAKTGSVPRPVGSGPAAGSAADFATIEGVFHDGLGTFAELSLANNLIELARLNQPPFNTTASEAKMLSAIERLPANHPARRKFEIEKANIAASTMRGAESLLSRADKSALVRVHHTARDFSDAKAADLVLEFKQGERWPVSVKTEKSDKIAVAEGQTPEIFEKWAARYFQMSRAEFDELIRDLGFASLAELKASYRNVSQFVAQVLIRKLGLTDCEPDDFSRARVTKLDAAKFLFQQLARFKHGNDGSTVIIFDRANGSVAWGSKLEVVEVEKLTAERISFRPSRPRGGQPIATEFGIKIDGQVVVTFQIKHKRGKARGSQKQFEFSDITTRLII